MPSYTVKSISERADWFLFHLPNLNERQYLKTFLETTFPVVCKNVWLIGCSALRQFSTNSLRLQKELHLYWIAWVFFQGCTEAEPFVQTEKDPATYAAAAGALHLPHQLQQHPPAVLSTRSTMPAQGKLKGQGEPRHGQGQTETHTHTQTIIVLTNAFFDSE